MELSFRRCKLTNHMKQYNIKTQTAIIQGTIYHRFKSDFMHRLREQLKWQSNSITLCLVFLAGSPSGKAQDFDDFFDYKK